MILRIAVTFAMLVLAEVAPMLAQPREDGGISVGSEVTRDRFHYTFENPSSFDTAELVPHEFTQTYWGDNAWLIVRARFNADSHLFETEFAATPQRSTRGDDYDAFFQPWGDVAISGTTGNVSLRSWRVRQLIGLGRRAGVDWKLGYQYRRDRSVFHPGYKTISHTQPPSIEESITYDRETTISENFEPQIAFGREWERSRWRVHLGVDASPATNARLTTYLPDKYPGRTIVFTAIVVTLSPAMSVTYGSRWPVTFSGGYTTTFSYVKRRQFKRNAITIGLGLAWNK